MKKYRFLIPILHTLVGLLVTSALHAQSVPTISSFSPTSGVIGTSITIIGTNFDSTPTNNIVYFGATRATVTTATSTQLTVTVPTGATYAPITVLNTATGLLAYSNSNFTPTFTPNKGDITSSDFSAKVDYTTGTTSRSVAIGDLDGDGKADLAVANLSSNTVSVFRNTGSSGTISYAAKVDFTTGTSPASVAIGDLDGDGKADLAVTNYNSNTVSVFRNTGSSGTIGYAAKVDFTTGTTPESVAIGDLDGDGKADLAVANQSSSTVSVFRNTGSSGTITYAAKLDFTTGSGPESVAIGDLDGDGKADLAVAGASPTVSVFRNTGSSGTINYAAKVDFTTGTYPYFVAIGDLDGDGKADLAVANYGSTTISVFRNTGSGTISYTAKVDFTTGSGPISVAIGDLDGDGKADLAVANLNSNTVSVFRNTGSSGTISYAAKVDFTTGDGPYSVAIGDLDGDGKADLAVANGSNTVSVIRNNPVIGSPPTIASFTPTSGVVGTSVTITGTNFTGATAVSFGGTAASSFNIVSATSITAVVASGSSGNVSVTTPGGTITLAGFTFTSSSIPTITSFTPGAGPVGTSVTITGSNFSATLANNIVYFGATKATVTAATSTQLTVTVPTGATYAPITVLNTATGLLAYAKSNFTPTFTPSKGDITTTDFSAKVDFTTGTNPWSVALGDLDGDGKADLAVTNYNSNTVSVFRNTGSSGTISYAAKVDFTTVTTPRSVAIGDLDGDGKADLAVANEGSTTVSVFRNTGSSGTISYAAKLDFTTGSGPESVAIGDLDGDGKADLAVANEGSTTVSVFRNTGSSGTISYAAKVDFTTGLNAFSVAIGDLDGDGKADLSVANSNSNTVSVFRNTGSIGTISYAAKVDFTTGSYPYSVAIGDLDGDGRADLAVANRSSATVSVFRNTGSSGTISYAAKVDFTTGPGPISVAIGDLDGDGKADLAVANVNSTTVSVFRNTGSSGTISYAAKVDFTTGDGPYSVAIGDLDGDGKADLAVANYGSNTVSAIRNNPVIGSPPTIASFTPTSGVVGTSVTITGTNFTDATAVSFGGTAASSFNVVSATSITSVVAAGTSGSVSVTTPGGTASLAGFTFILAPTVSFFAPTSAGSGTTITITGTNFTGATAVSFGGTAATSFNVVSATSITAVVASGTSGIVSVTTPAGSGTLAGFTYIPAPTISSFTPTSGPVGTSVVITGTNFSTTLANNIVKFNGTIATIIGTPTATSITTSVPSGATTGKITVEVNGQTAASATNFSIGSISRLGRFIVDKITGCAPLTITIIDTNIITTGECTAGKPCEIDFESKGGQQNLFTYTYTTPGTFKLSILYQSIGADDISITVKDCDPPCTSSPITVSPSLTICVGASTTLTASGANTYSWSPAAGLSSSTGSSVIASPATTTTYTVVGTGEYGCTNNASVTVTIPPLLTVSPSSTICSGTFTSLIASGASSYSWSPAIGLSTTTESSVIASPTTTTIYVVIGTDTNGCTQSKSVTVTVNKPCAIPNLANGNGLEAYRIFSIPLKLSDKKIETVLASVMQYYGGYDQDKWRLVHYSNGNNLNFTQGLSTIEEGKGYWLLSVDPLTINVSGTALPVNQSTPFIMNLDKGWNQIGNPFGFDILWSDVLSKNSNTTSVGELYVYNPATISFTKSDKLPAWGGGFVNTTNVSALNIPITVKQATGGRLSTSDESVSNQIDQPSWFIPLKLQHGEAINDLGGIGMHDEALLGRDKYDENSLPRFVKFLELNSYHNEYFQPRFMRDVVPSTSNYNWDLHVESNFGENGVTLSWEYEPLNRNNTQLLLYDKQAKVIVDMKKVGEYKFGSPATRELTIMYAIDENHLSSAFLKLGLPFPNPLSQETTIPFITGADEILINVYDMLGRKVKEVARSKFETGYHEIVWQGDDYLGERVSPGMYIIRVSGSNSPAASVRILVK